MLDDDDDDGIGPMPIELSRKFLESDSDTDPGEEIVEVSVFLHKYFHWSWCFVLFVYSQLAVACFWLLEWQSGAKNTIFPPAFAQSPPTVVFVCHNHRWSRRCRS